MKLRLAKLIGLVALCMCMIAPGMAQQVTYYHQLSADEFRGAPGSNSGDIIANTNCYIDFNYHAKSEKGVYRLTCEIKLVFDNNKSWINKKKVFSNDMMAEILKHEQGHYMIAYMEQQELARTISKTYFDASYQYEAASIFDRVHEKYKQLSLDYDDDTQHMQNRDQQRSWDNYFKKRLTFMPEEEIARR